MGTPKLLSVDQFFSLQIGDVIGLVYQRDGRLFPPTIDRASVVRVEVGERPHSKSAVQSRWRNCTEVVLRLFKPGGELGAEIVVGTLDPEGNTKRFIDMSMYRPVYSDPARLWSLAERLAGEVRDSLPGTGHDEK